jgi:hypothetical protein
VNTAQPPQTTRGQPEFTQIGNQNTIAFTQQDLGDLATAVDEQADLAAGFGGKGAKIPADFVGNNGLGWTRRRPRFSRRLTWLALSPSRLP